MRILFLSNFFPPARPGGYTQWCQEVAERLAGQGHTIGVLTSRYELEKAPASEQNIFRLLHLEGDLAYYQPFHFFTRWKEQHSENLAFLEQAVTDFAPDLIFVWGMWALSKTLPALAEKLLPGRVVYYLSDYWPSALDMHTAYWQSPTRHGPMRVPKRILGKAAMSMLAKEGQPDLKFEHVICVSARVRELLVEAGLPVQHARIIHGGTAIGRFLDVRKREYSSGCLKLLYAGQLVRHKGVHTAVEAMARLVNRRKIHQVTLTLVGSGHPEYESYLRQLVEKEHLQDYVIFHKSVSKDQMPAILQQYDVLIFPSIYEEPLARMTQEAMASGLVVVGTTTGGTTEILKDGETGLTFAPEDADGLTEQVTRLFNDSGLCCRLAQAGRQTVLENFTLDKMVKEIEDFLLECFTRSSKVQGFDLER
ncbi:MAG TPA: glycosyltransferase family 4 protein [Anaerolineales bacterium]|jgi:glycosyltransferase involved in cell wall biosynthesis|nr:glycosyltransferase family 4 protein [Anaerolineales bacterium]